MSNPPILSYRPPNCIAARFLALYAWFVAGFFVPIAFFTGTLIFVVPKFKETYKDFRTTLPPVTQWLMALASFMFDDYWFISLPLIAVCLLAVPALPAFYAALPEVEATRRRRAHRLLLLLLLLSVLLMLTLAVALGLPFIR